MIFSNSPESNTSLVGDVGDGLLGDQVDAADAIRRHVQLARRRIDEPLDQV
jgi:hypothetical protein